MLALFFLLGAKDFVGSPHDPSLVPSRIQESDALIVRAKRVIVRPGQVVSTGQVIGYEGSTGFSTGCHLHFAINAQGVWEHPRRFLP